MTGNNLPILSRFERQVLRDLALQVAGLAARPVEDEKRREWHRHNALLPGRPMVFCDPENGWNEIFPPQSLLCTSELARHWEFELRIKEFYGTRMRDDRVIDNRFVLRPVAQETGWGLHTAIIGRGDGRAFTWDPPLKDLDDLSGLRVPGATVDGEATARLRALAGELFDRVLTVEVKGVWWWSLGMTQRLVYLRGLERMMLDMLENPEGFHRLMAFMRDAQLARLDQLEADGLLCLNNGNDYVGSGGFGFTEELPAPGYGGRARTADLWGFCESQETLGVSPAMFEEFVFQYQLPILERFGLNCYGCCEPLDGRWEVVRKTPRLRRVSVSAWAEPERMADYLGKEFIFSAKPNPAHLAPAVFDETPVRRDLRRIIEAADGGPLELIMKDNHTIANDPARVCRWVEIARGEIDRAAG